jgi:RNA polymerase sigma-70 factor (family 1)
MAEQHSHTIQTNETQVVAALRAGQQEAFTQLYKYFQQRVYWFAKKYVEQRADAQDVTADTFIQLWKHRTDFESLDAISAFLHVTARNKCYDLLRREQMKSSRQMELLQLIEQHETEDFYVEQVRLELMRKIYAEVDKLPARMKEIFILSYQEGLKPAQIAERLQIKVQTVTNQRVSAIKVLKAAWQKNLC